MLDAAVPQRDRGWRGSPDVLQVQGPVVDTRHVAEPDAYCAFSFRPARLESRTGTLHRVHPVDQGRIKLAVSAEHAQAVDGAFGLVDPAKLVSQLALLQVADDDRLHRFLLAEQPFDKLLRHVLI